MYVTQTESATIAYNSNLYHNTGGHVEGTQLLTSKGWKDISQINKEDNVIQWNPDGSMDFVQPLTISSSEVPYTLTLRNQQGHINQEVSPNHNIIYDYKGIAQEVSVRQMGSLYLRELKDLKV